MARRQMVNLRLPMNVLAAVRKRAEKDGVSRTSVVEAALRAFLGVPSVRRYVEALEAEIRRRGLKVPTATVAKARKRVTR